jgi:hypothetical protein
VLAFGAVSGCQLPDAILHGKRSFRPRSRAVQCLAVAGLSSEAFQLASAGGCATGLRTRSRHVCSFTSRLHHLAPGRPPLLTVRLPEATGLASYLSGCLSSTARRPVALQVLRSGFATHGFQVRLFMALPSGCPFAPAFRQNFPGRSVCQAPEQVPERTATAFSLLQTEVIRYTEKPCDQAVERTFPAFSDS